MSVERILAGKGRHVETIPPSHRLQEAAQILAAKRIGAVVVVSHDRAVLGILSERDIVRAIAQDPAHLNSPVSDFMTHKVVTCGLYCECLTLKAGRGTSVPLKNLFFGKRPGKIGIFSLKQGETVCLRAGFSS